MPNSDLDVEISAKDTIMSLADGSSTTVRPMIRSTYWDGLDLVPAASSLFDAEFRSGRGDQCQGHHHVVGRWLVNDRAADDPIHLLGRSGPGAGREFTVRCRIPIWTWRSVPRTPSCRWPMARQRPCGR